MWHFEIDQKDILLLTFDWLVVPLINTDYSVLHMKRVQIELIVNKQQCHFAHDCA